jgi:hypothetical protein
MPTFSITGKRQQTITALFVCETDDPAQAIMLFRQKHPGITGVTAKRSKDVTVIVAPQPVAPVVASKKKTGKK